MWNSNGFECERELGTVIHWHFVALLLSCPDVVIYDLTQGQTLLFFNHGYGIQLQYIFISSVLGRKWSCYRCCPFGYPIVVCAVGENIVFLSRGTNLICRVLIQADVVDWPKYVFCYLKEYNLQVRSMCTFQKITTLNTY